MATFSLNRKASYHARSISLPSRSHPLTIKVEEQLYRFRSSESISPSSVSSSSIVSSLSGLKNLHDSVDGLLQLPLAQQVLSHDRSHKCMDEVLNDSLQILDVCGTSRDVLLQTKECVQDVRFSLHRRRVGEVGMENDVGLYMKSRKEIYKVIQKCLTDVKRMENKHVFCSVLEKDHNLVAIVGVLRQVEVVTLSMLESLLCFVSVSKTKSKQKGWSLVAKLMNKEEADVNEIEKADAVLSSFSRKRSTKGDEVVSVQNVQMQLEALELSFQSMEDGLVCVQKSLIQTRVTLLNMLSQ